LEEVDFAPLLLNGVLAFLLFAGAVEVALRPLVERRWTVLALSTVSVGLSTALIGVGAWAVFQVMRLPIPLYYCLAFGALISPTDPVTVLGVLRHSKVPDGLRAVISGESLFNDGIGIVLFGMCMEAALAGPGRDLPSAGAWLLDFARESVGGMALGGLTGGLAYLAMRGIDEYGIELIISLTLVTATYGLAGTISVSGPVAVVVAGLIMGSVGKQYAVSETTHDYLSKFWSLVDQVLNALLYLLVGLQFAVISLDWRSAWAALATIALVLLARAISVAVPGVPLNLQAPHKLRAISIITWSGLRGGISLALALSIPHGAYRDPLITVTYAVVVFTMVVQGLSLSRLAGALYPHPAASP
jgi:Na+:H+ antiporter